MHCSLKSPHIFLYSALLLPSLFSWLWIRIHGNMSPKTFRFFLEDDFNFLFVIFEKFFRVFFIDLRLFPFFLLSTQSHLRLGRTLLVYILMNRARAFPHSVRVFPRGCALLGHLPEGLAWRRKFRHRAGTISAQFLSTKPSRSNYLACKATSRESKQTENHGTFLSKRLFLCWTRWTCVRIFNNLEVSGRWINLIQRNIWTFKATELEHTCTGDGRWLLVRIGEDVDF